MKNMETRKITWKKNSKYNTLEERELAYFKDFSGARTKSNAYKIKNLDIAEKLIRENLHNTIRIVGDYDVDGMTAVASLMLMFTELNAENVDWYTPKRFTDGYGLSINIVNNLPKLNGNSGLLITIDNGIAAIEAMSYAKELGWTILILDHHLPVRDDEGNIILPIADCIIDPHAIAGSANFDDYCGAGLAFKLAQHMNLSASTMMKITSLAAIGTVCDSVNFITEIGGHYAYDNYLIVKEGLSTLVQNDGRTTGLYCLLRSLGLDYSINEEDIGYVLGPTLNAGSRLYDNGASFSVDLLLTEGVDFSAATQKAEELIECNKTRKKMTEDILPIIEQRIADDNMQNDYPLVICGNEGEIHLGLVGIIAGKIAEKYRTIGICCTPIDNTVIKGSSRALMGSNIKDILDHCSDKLIAFGGHQLAAGLSLNKETLDAFREASQNYAGEKPEELFENFYDFEITPDEANSTLETLKKYAPFGKGHECPIFKFNFTPEMKAGMYYNLLGKDKKIIKFNNHYCEAINFTGDGKNIYEELGRPKHVFLYGTLGVNSWQGQERPQFKFSDIENADTE